MTGVDVEVLVTAELTMPEAYVFRPQGPRVTGFASLLRPGGGTLKAPCLAYVVRHPQRGTILIDTGMHPDVSTDLHKDFGRLMSLMFRKIRPAAESFDAALRAQGVGPDEVELVVMTHLHVDHTSGMRLLPNAQFVCAREEWAAATKPNADRAGYVAHHLPPAERVQQVDLARDGEPHGPFARTLDLLGDGSMRLISTPGHTVGHLSVLLRLADGGEALVAGDAAYTARSIAEERLPLLTIGDDRYRASLRELKAYTDANPGVPVIPTHDPDAWRALAQRRPTDAHAA